MGIDSSLKHDYRDQAARYDLTRGMSRTVVAVIADAIDGTPGRRLLDVGGGTANYAASLRERGWAPTLLDASPQMRQVAQSKGLTAIAGEASDLPFGERTFDAVTMISMLHQVSDWRRALSETTRVLRPHGRLAVMLLTARELLEGLLLPSGADAAYLLAQAYGPGPAAFVARMNAAAKSLGTASTGIVKPST